jgi:hypothetical protein
MAKNKMQARCDRCRFWRGITRRGVHPDSRQGDCHRHAPVAELETVRNTFNVLGRLAWAVEKQVQIEHGPTEAYRRSDIFSHSICWPITCGADWCGDFEPRRRP